MVPQQKLKVLDVEYPIHGVKKLILDPLQVGPYKAGQYLNLVHPQSEERWLRSYSFYTCPDSDAQPGICFKRIDNGRMSRYLYDQIKPGDYLISKGVQGLFCLPEDLSDCDQLFFFAAGIGITPIFSMIKSALHRGFAGRIVLVYANSSRSTTLFYDALKQLAEMHQDRFVLDLFFSSNKDLLRARLSKQVLEGLVPRLSKASPERTVFFTCGPHAFMRMIQFGLIEQGFSADQIRREHFHTQVGVTVHWPQDKGSYEVELEWKGQQQRFMAGYPDTILQAALKHGLDLPYSCEVGMCGSCLAYLTEGEVWHRQNEVLTDKDLQEGKILTCVAYPQGGPVRLQWDPPVSADQQKTLNRD